MQEGGGGRGTRFSEFYLFQIKKKRAMIKIKKNWRTVVGSYLSKDLLFY